MHSHYRYKYIDHRWKSHYHFKTSKTNQIQQSAVQDEQIYKNEHSIPSLVRICSVKGSKQQKQQVKESKKATGDKISIKVLLLLSFTILGLVIFTDIQRHGSWKGSVLANLLKDYHVCEYSHKVLNKTSVGIKWINSEIDKQFPGYEKKLHETLEPYSELFSDLGLISYKVILNAKDSIVLIYGNLIQKIEEYAPGFLDQTGDVIKNALSKLSSLSRKSFNYLREEVFIGNLAPEHMWKVMVDLLNSALQQVNEFYVWGYEKVRTVIK